MVVGAMVCYGLPSMKAWIMLVLPTDLSPMKMIFATFISGSLDLGRDERYEVCNAGYGYTSPGPFLPELPPPQHDPFFFIHGMRNIV